MIQSIYNVTDYVNSLLMKYSAAALGLMLGVLVILEIVEVVLRNIFSTGFFWFADVTGILLLFLSWIGSGYLWIARAHLIVDILPVTSERINRSLRLASEITVLVGVIWLIPIVLQTMDLHKALIMPTLAMPASIKYLPMLIGVMMIGFGATNNILKEVAQTKLTQ